ncbi:uncharacterized protein LOC133796243 [Humulus lupulus]|uniref:uncharacterized protein LOC133796243 n=1 Tax=Humulus lupulus TaxID=3486 RepID=UPI002B4184AF|nr:uncharacterized protein LOC133796243 [Humulus lupulus]
MKIDISKAYDSIDWDFLENLLKALRFPGRFIRWIMVCLRGTSCCLLMNGRIQGCFQGGRGLRQGDPISLTLFVIVMDYLTRLLLKASKEKDFRFHPLCKSLNIISLCFADDLLLICKANENVVQIIQRTFEVFSSSSGLVINNHKSRIFFGGVSDPVKVSFETNSVGRRVVHGKLHLSKLYYLIIPGAPISSMKSVWCSFSVPKHMFILLASSKPEIAHKGPAPFLSSVYSLFGLSGWESLFGLRNMKIGVLGWLKLDSIIKFSVKARVLSINTKKLSSREKQLIPFISSL